MGTRKHVKNPEVKSQRRIGIMNVRNIFSHGDTRICLNSYSPYTASHLRKKLKTGRKCTLLQHSLCNPFSDNLDSGYCNVRKVLEFTLVI